MGEDFGRDANVTRSFDRFMDIAYKIRDDHRKQQPHRPPLKHIFVATDNNEAAKRTLSNDYPDWIFHIQDTNNNNNAQQQKIQRGNDNSPLIWFKNLRAGSVGTIGADIEMLRRAD